MIKFIAVKLLLFSLLMMSFTAQTQAQSAERIKFKPGESSATFGGRLADGSAKDYVIEAKPNQKLTVTLTINTQDILFAISDEHHKLLTNDSDNDGYEEITTTYYGDYYINIANLTAKRAMSYEVRIALY